MNLNTKKQHFEAGQAMVEFTLTIGLILFVLFMILAVMRMLNLQSLVDRVSQEGSRQAAQLGGGTDEVTSYINQQYISLGGQPGTLAVTVQRVDFDEITDTFEPTVPASEFCGYGDYILVTVDADFAEALPEIGLFTSALNVEGTMRSEHLRQCWRGGQP